MGYCNYDELIIGVYMKNYLEKCFNIIKILLVVFTIMNCLFNHSYAAIELDRALENLGDRIEFESEVDMMTIFISFILIIVFIILIITLLIFHKKIPSTPLYIIIASLVIGISVIATLFGKELLNFCQALIDIQMSIVNDKMMNF